MAIQDRVLVLTEAEQAAFYGPPNFTANDQRWNPNSHEKELTFYLDAQAKLWSEPRCLFDAAVEYLSNQKIVLPGYSTLLKLIGQAIINNQNDLINCLNESLSDVAKQAIDTILVGQGELSLRQLRQTSRNFTGSELAKELAVHQHVAQWIPEVSAALDALSLSQKNQQHFAERVDYYGAKLKRQSLDNQRRSLDEATWQYYEQRDSLRVGLIRKLFLYLQIPSRQNWKAHLAGNR